MESLERGLHLDVCTPAFFVRSLLQRPRRPLSEGVCGSEGQEKLFLSPVLKLQD